MRQRARSWPPSPYDPYAFVIRYDRYDLLSLQVHKAIVRRDFSTVVPVQLVQRGYQVDLNKNGAAPLDPS